MGAMTLFELGSFSFHTGMSPPRAVAHKSRFTLTPPRGWFKRTSSALERHELCSSTHLRCYEELALRIEIKTVRWTVLPRLHKRGIEPQL